MYNLLSEISHKQKTRFIDKKVFLVEKRTFSLKYNSTIEILGKYGIQTVEQFKVLEQLNIIYPKYFNCILKTRILKQR